MRHLRDRGKVLHLEGVRARALEVDGAGVRPHQALDSGSDQRVVESGLDAEGGHHAQAEAARGLVDGVGDQKVVARLDAGHDRRRDGGEPGGEGRRAMAAFELDHQLLERHADRHVEHAVGRDRLVGVEAPLHLAHVGERFERDGGSARDGQVDGARIRSRGAAALDQARALLHRPSARTCAATSSVVRLPAASSITSASGTVSPATSGRARPISMMWWPPGRSSTLLPAGRARFSMDRMRITPLSIAEEWISAEWASGERTETTFAASVLCRVRKAPVESCAGTVPRTQASVAVTPASAGNERQRHPQRNADERSLSKDLLHFLSHLYLLRRRIVFDIVPAHGFAIGDGTLELYLVGEANRQRLPRRRIGGGHEFAPYGVAALAIEHLAGPERALPCRNAIAAPSCRRPPRLAAQRRARHAD